jgi:N-acetylmuramoyl-L-alanine amidase
LERARFGYPVRVSKEKEGRNAACYDNKLVIRGSIRVIAFVHRLSKCLTLTLGVCLFSGCETQLQRPVAIQAVAPDLEIAPAAAIELPAHNATIIQVASLAAAPVIARPSQPRGTTQWPTNWINTWVPLEGWREYNDLAALTRSGAPAQPTFRVQTANGTFSMKIGTRVAHYDGLEYWLGFAPQLIGGMPYVYWLDAQKTLQPLVRAANYWCDKSRATIVIDAGHGGRDVGAQSIVNGSYEKDYTLDWALRVQQLLKNNGWNVLMTRTSDVDLDLGDRVAMAERANADFFLSLHFNSGGSNRDLAGIETYCLTPVGMPSHLTRSYEDDVRQVFPNNAFDEQNFQAAVGLHRALMKSSSAPDRGVRRARFMSVLRGQNRPATLIEGGYLSNPKEAQRIGSANYRQILAEAVARGLQMPP